jgi:hypothetical protein
MTIPQLQDLMRRTNAGAKSFSYVSFIILLRAYGMILQKRRGKFQQKASSQLNGHEQPGYSPSSEPRGRRCHEFSDTGGSPARNDLIADKRCQETKGCRWCDIEQKGEGSSHFRRGLLRLAVFKRRRMARIRLFWLNALSQLCD